MKQTIAIILALVCCLSGMSTERTDSISRPKRAASIVSGAAIGLAVNAALTEGGKHAIHEMRPDRSSNNT